MMSEILIAATASPFRLFLRARRIATLALGLALCELGYKLDPRLRRGLQIVEAELRIGGLERSVALLQARLLSIPARRRPRFTTQLARAALALHDRSGASSDETARALVLTARTLIRWHRRRELSPNHELVLGPACLPQPPCTRINDATRERVVQIRQDAALLGKGLTALLLAHVGCRVSTSSVGRITYEGSLERPMLAPRSPLRLVTTGRRCRGRLGSPRRRWLRGAPPVPVPVPVPAPVVRLLPELGTYRRTRLLVELRDQFHMGVIALLTPLRRQPDTTLARRLTCLHEREARLLELRRILQARLLRVRPSARPHYTPSARAEIVIHKHAFRLSDRATAAIYVLARQTVGTWNSEVDRPKPSQLVSLQPAIADHEEAIRRASALLPALSARQADIAALLAGLTPAAPPRSRPRERSLRGRAGRGATASRCLKRQPGIRSRHPNDCWSVDLTELRSLFGIHRPYLAVILDLYSRFPVAWKLWSGRPRSADLAELLEEALAAWGPPRHLLVSHLVSDQGGEFVGEPFERVLAAHCIQHRFGAIGEHGSIAIIERLWLTLKIALENKDLPRLRFDETESRIAVAIDWYARMRPHSTLRGATPNERYLGLRPAWLDAAPPPRGRRGEPCVPRDAIELRFALPEERRLPYLVRPIV